MLGAVRRDGDIYARVILHMKQPRGGLLSIGEEEHKGNELTRTATPLLKSLAIHFIGNVEGRTCTAERWKSSSRRLQSATWR